jgi:hypothetical protein
VYKGKSIYFVFNVLPFGIASAGHIFTKLLKEVVKYWRNQACAPEKSRNGGKLPLNHIEIKNPPFTLLLNHLII